MLMELFIAIYLLVDNFIGLQMNVESSNIENRYLKFISQVDEGFILINFNDY